MPKEESKGMGSGLGILLIVGLIALALSRGKPAEAEELPPEEPLPEYPVEFICPYCLEPFSNYDDMIYHIIYTHPEAPKPPPPPEPPKPVLGAVTIDGLEIQIDLDNAIAYTNVAITNNTGAALISRPSDWIYTKLSITGYYAGKEYSYSARKPGSHHDRLYTIKPCDSLDLLFSTTATSGIGDIPPGTTTKALSYSFSSRFEFRTALENMPEPKKGYAVAHFWQVDQRPTPEIYYADAYGVFKGNFGSQSQAWAKVPFTIGEEIRPIRWWEGRPYREITLLDGSGVVLKI